MNMNKLSSKLAAVTLSLCAAALPAAAGRGGSADLINSAVRTGSVDAIVAEVERAEKLMCEACLDTMIALTEHPRFEVREVAAWWFAKRPGSAKIMVSQMTDDLQIAGSIQVRNAADFVGRIREFSALPALGTALQRTDISTDAKVAIVRAVGFMAHPDGNAILTAAFRDGSPEVRTAAITAWRDILGQLSAAPIVSLLADPDARVRAEAAIVVGAYGELAGRATLEGLVVKDSDAFVRRNAAWALGRIGAPESAIVLTFATNDSSGIVRGVAKGSLANLAK
jgi:HEAT repeat protein